MYVCISDIYVHAKYKCQSKGQTVNGRPPKHKSTLITCSTAMLTYPIQIYSKKKKSDMPMPPPNCPPPAGDLGVTAVPGFACVCVWTGDIFLFLRTLFAGGDRGRVGEESLQRDRDASKVEDADTRSTQHAAQHMSAHTADKRQKWPRPRN